jgi:hypothetical protein
MVSSVSLIPEPATCDGNSMAPFMEDLSPQEYTILLALAWKVFTNSRRFGFDSDDEAAEAFIRYKNRLKSIIKRSEIITGNKEAYTDSCLRFLAKSVQRSLRKKELVDYVLESAGESGGCILVQTESFLESFHDSGGDNQQFIGSITPSCFLSSMCADQKRLLFLTIKCAWEVDDAMAEKVAGRLGVPILWLCSILHQARATLEPARLFHTRLNERINTMWLRLRLIEAELRGENVSQERRGKLQCSAVLSRNRYETLLLKKARFHLLVSNRAIAELLRVPKGSIDSGLFYLKTALRGKLDKE